MSGDSDLSAALDRIHKLDGELSSSDRSLNDMSDPPAQVEQLELPDHLSEVSSENPFVQNDDISSFCKKFNKKVGVATNTLDEVMEMVEIILSSQAAEANGANDQALEKLRTRNKALKVKHNELRAEFSRVVSQNDNLQTSIDELRYENHRLTEELALSQQRLAASQQETNDMKERLAREAKGRNLLEGNIANLGDIIQNQLTDAAELTGQRDRLIDIVKMQNQVIQKFDRALAKTVEENSELKQKVSEPVPVPEFESDLPMALAILTRSVCDRLPTMEGQMSVIRDDTECDIPKKIETIVDHLSSEIVKNESGWANEKGKIADLEKTVNELRDKCVNVLALFGEEVQFMQKLAHSNDLQDCIFFRPERADTLNLDESTKSEWIRHCARVSKYIEETIPTLNVDQVSDAFSDYQNVIPTEIFDFMSSDCMEKKMRGFMSRIEANPSLEIHELFMMFCAQAFTNDILQNHAVELRLRRDLAIREMNQMKSDFVAAQESLKSAQKIIRRFEKREEKTISLIADNFEFEKKGSLLSIVKGVLGHVEKLREADPDVVRKLQKEKAELVESMNEQIKMIEADLAKAEDLLNEKTQQYEEWMAQKEQEFEEEQLKRQDVEKKLSDAQADFAAVTQEFQEHEEAHQREMADFKETAENMAKELQEKICSLQESLDTAGDALEESAQKIQELKSDKKEAKERIAYLESIQLKSVQALKAKSESLRQEFGKTLEDNRHQMDELRETLTIAQSERHELQQRNEQLGAELRNAMIEHKALELKLRSNEEKAERDKRTTAVQMAAKLERTQQEANAKLSAFVEHQQTVLSNFIDFSKEKCRGEFDDIEDFDQFMETLRRYLDDNHERETVYEETVADIMKVKQALGLSPSDEMFKTVSGLIGDKKRLTKEAKQAEEALAEQEKRYGSLYKTVSKFENDVASLRQWETWARRIHRIVHESASTSFSSDQLRVALEEALLSSVSHRSIVNRLNSLREQKKALVTVDPHILTTKSDLKPSMMGLIGVCVAALRLQRISGCVRVDNVSSQSPRKPRSPSKVGRSPESTKGTLFKRY